jgi:hypothetical protein
MVLSPPASPLPISNIAMQMISPAQSKSKSDLALDH